MTPRDTATNGQRNVESVARDALCAQIFEDALAYLAPLLVGRLYSCDRLRGLLPLLAGDTRARWTLVNLLWSGLLQTGLSLARFQLLAPLLRLLLGALAREVTLDGTLLRRLLNRCRSLWPGSLHCRWTPRGRSCRWPLHWWPRHGSGRSDSRR